MTTQTAVAGPSQACSPAQRVTRSLLGYGVLAGTVFEVSILIQGLTRHGFRLAHDDASLLSNGPLGWIQIATFLRVRRDDDRVRRRDAARAGRPGGRHLGAAADRDLRRRADGGRAAARRSGRRFRPGGARGKGGARQLARGRAPDLGEHRVHRPDRGVLRRGPLLQPGAAPRPGHLLARQRPGLPGRVRGRHHRVQFQRHRAAVLRRRAHRLDLDRGDLRPPVPPRRRCLPIRPAVDIHPGIQPKYNENRRKKCVT